MRQGQQKRMRGRNRSNGSGGGGGKGPNNLNRTFESNGPDVKVRGTAAHIAEKYVQLARDAQSSGDPILAEAYLQHAEHYFRVIAAAQPQYSGQPSFPAQAEEEDDGEDFEFDGPVPSMPQPVFSQAPQPPGGQGDDQPRFQPQRERNFNDRGYGGDRPHYADRQDGERFQRDRFQNDRGPRQDRGQNSGQERGQNSGQERGQERSEDGGEGERGFNPRQNRHNRRDNRFQDRPYQDRQQGNNRGYDNQGGERPAYQERPYQAQPVVPIDQPQPDIADDAALSALPSFITGSAPPAPVAAPAAEGEGEARFPLRARRRRTPKRAAGEEGEAPAPETGVEPVGE